MRCCAKPSNHLLAVSAARRGGLTPQPFQDSAFGSPPRSIVSARLSHTPHVPRQATGTPFRTGGTASCTANLTRSATRSTTVSPTRTATWTHGVLRGVVGRATPKQVICSCRRHFFTFCFQVLNPELCCVLFFFLEDLPPVLWCGPPRQVCGAENLGTMGSGGFDEYLLRMT